MEPLQEDPPHKVYPYSHEQAKIIQRPGELYNTAERVAFRKGCISEVRSLEDLRETLTDSLIIRYSAVKDEAEFQSTVVEPFVKSHIMDPFTANKYEKQYFKDPQGVFHIGSLSVAAALGPSEYEKIPAVQLLRAAANQRKHGTRDSGPPNFATGDEAESEGTAGALASAERSVCEGDAHTKVEPDVAVKLETDPILNAIPIQPNPLPEGSVSGKSKKRGSTADLLEEERKSKRGASESSTGSRKMGGIRPDVVGYLEYLRTGVIKHIIFALELKWLIPLADDNPTRRFTFSASNGSAKSEYMSKLSADGLVWAWLEAFCQTLWYGYVAQRCGVKILATQVNEFWGRIMLLPGGIWGVEVSESQVPRDQNKLIAAPPRALTTFDAFADACPTPPNSLFRRNDRNEVVVDDDSLEEYSKFLRTCIFLAGTHKQDDSPGLSIDHPGTNLSNRTYLAAVPTKKMPISDAIAFNVHTMREHAATKKTHAIRKANKAVSEGSDEKPDEDRSGSGGSGSGGGHPDADPGDQKEPEDRNEQGGPSSGSGGGESGTDKSSGAGNAGCGGGHGYHLSTGPHLTAQDSKRVINRDDTAPASVEEEEIDEAQHYFLVRQALSEMRPQLLLVSTTEFDILADALFGGQEVTLPAESTDLAAYVLDIPPALSSGTKSTFGLASPPSSPVESLRPTSVTEIHGSSTDSPPSGARKRRHTESIVREKATP